MYEVLIWNSSKTLNNFIIAAPAAIQPSAGLTVKVQGGEEKICAMIINMGMQWNFYASKKLSVLTFFH